MLEAFGGRFLVRGGNISYSEGEQAEIDVVGELPDVAAAHAFISRDPYKELKPARTENATRQLMVIEGV